MATKVLVHLVKPTQPIGKALEKVKILSEAGLSAVEGQDDTWRELTETALLLQDDHEVERLINSTTLELGGTARRRRIIAGARRTLEGYLAEVGDLLARFLDLRQSIRASMQGTVAAGTELEAAVERCTVRIEVSTVGDAALSRFLGWLRETSNPEPRGTALAGLLHDDLKPLWEIPRDEANRPQRMPSLAEVAVLLKGREPSEVVAGYLDAGNIEAARRYLEEHDHDVPAEGVEDLIAHGERQAAERHNRDLETVRWLSARLRALYEDDLARELISESQSLAKPDPSRFDLARNAMSQLIRRGQSHLDAYRNGLRARVDKLDKPAADKERILRLLDNQDEILAVDFLTRLQGGLALPAVDHDSGDDFQAFFPDVVRSAAAAEAAGEPVIDTVRNSLAAPPKIENRQLREGVRAWEELRHLGRGLPTSEFRLAVARAMRMIGLVPRSQVWMK
ncbi:hypothetical protein, partial [Nocardia sp. NPDC019302]|uniref:hypothetical protein n=1 Tax=Nocardia sp. NPDC019302 TaxID=3154592 RepID=UPI0033E8F64C